MASKNANKIRLILLSLSVLVIVVAGLFLFSSKVYAQSVNTCAALSSSSIPVNAKFNIPILTNNGWPFVWTPTNGIPQLNSMTLDPIFQPQLDVACRQNLISFVGSADYAVAATNCQKQCTRNNSPALQCSGTPTLSCSVLNTAANVICNALPTISNAGSNTRLYQCDVPASIVLTCTCSGGVGGN